MSIPVQCDFCGLVFAAPIGGTGPVRIIDCGAICPRCRNAVDIPSGSYEFVENAVAAFTKAGVSRDNVFRLGEVAKQVQEGALTTAEASDKIAQLGPALTQVWKWTNDNGQMLALLLMIVALYLQVTQGSSNDAAAAKQLKESQKQTQVSQSAEHVQRKILEELQKHTEAETRKAQQEQSQAQSQAQTPTTGALTRQQRRALERAWKKRPPRRR